MTNMDFYVTPVLNIDGYIYTWENTTVGSSVPFGLSNYFRRARMAKATGGKEMGSLKRTTFPNRFFSARDGRHTDLFPSKAAIQEPQFPLVH